MSDFRKAIHVGDLPFGAQSGDVYYSMNDDFMQSERETIEFLLEKYPVKPSSHYYVDHACPKKKEMTTPLKA